MAFAECGNGHLYDPEQYAVCPYCNGGGNRIEFAASGSSDIGKTAPVGGGFGGGRQSTPEALFAGGEIGATVAPSDYKSKHKEEEDSLKTVGIFQKSMKLEPVVGWLVCIDGPDKGKDFRIYARNNTIGRNEKMDICIKGDTTISRENHARLAYDGKHNNFHLIPAESTNNIYINDEPIYLPTKLESYDLIELGDSKFTFVPLCCEKFTWQDGLNK